MRSLYRFSIIIAVIAFALTSCSKKDKKNKSLSPASDKTYIDKCGKCHFAYQPGLLTFKSWEKIILTPDGHAGGALSIDKKIQDELISYLREESAEKSSWKKAKKILNYNSNKTPVRISENSYIQTKHRRIKQDVLNRSSIKSLGNCSACHKNAAKGIYEENDVAIPD
jgi:cytochrome c553